MYKKLRHERINERSSSLRVLAYAAIYDHCSKNQKEAKKMVRLVEDVIPHVPHFIVPLTFENIYRFRDRKFILEIINNFLKKKARPSEDDKRNIRGNERRIQYYSNLIDKLDVLKVTEITYSILLDALKVTEMQEYCAGLAEGVKLVKTHHADKFKDKTPKDNGPHTWTRKKGELGWANPKPE